MANPSNHLQQWKHNRAFLAWIPSDFSDWFITATFYTALHAVDVLLRADGVPRATSHQSRNAILRETKRYESIWKRYRPLYDLSQSVRYLAAPKTWISYQQADSLILARYLYPIESSVKKLLSDHAALGAEGFPDDRIVLQT
jgi:hypothetical protein